MDASMLIKAAITTVIAAALAGGVVYYGMPDAGTQRTAQVSTDRSEPIKKSWIDKHLKENSNQSANSDREDFTDQSEPGSIDKDLETIQEPDEPTEMVDPDPELAQEDRYVPNVSEIDTQGKPDEPLRDLKPISDEMPVPSLGVLARLDAVQEQIEAIKQVELKDEAILELVEFAASTGQFVQATEAIDHISQEQLRDTARGWVAIAYAKAGRSDDAFAIIEDIEIEPLKDAMRLQTIRALIAPHKLPKPMQ